MNQLNIIELKNRISWGSVFGGVMTVLAISILLSILASSISLFKLDPLSDDPASGIGTTVGIWSAIALIVSMIAGGFIAGKLAGRDGMIHGFLVWATTLILAAIFTAMLAIGAVKMAGNVLGAASSVVGNVASGVGSVAGSGISALSDQAKGLFGEINIDTDVQSKDIPRDIRRALSKSGVKELQPEYLQKQLKGVKSDLGKSVKKVVANPKDAEDIFGDFMDRLKKRTDKITKNIDRDDVSKAIANNTNLSKAEADKAVDQYMDMLNSAQKEAQEQINNLQQTMQQATQQWNEMKHQALVAADEATDAAARSALISFFALLIAAVLCVLAGMYGSRKTQERVDM